MKLRLTAVQSDIDSFISKIITKYHFNEEQRKELMQVYDDMMQVVSPYAVYRINQWITGVKQIDDNQAALVVITLGKGVDMLQDSYSQEGKLDNSYMVECMANEILLDMYDEFNSNYTKIHRRYVTGYTFVGEEIPLTKMRELIAKVQEKEGDNLQLKANEYGVITPSKSVLFYAMLSDNPMHACKGVCQCCGNKACDYRSKSREKNLNYGYQRIFSNNG